MAATPAEYADMDREELVQSLLEQDRRIEELEETIDGLEQTVDVVSDTTWDLSDSVYGEYGSTAGNIRIDEDGAILKRLEALEGSVDVLETENERMRARLDTTDGKDEKVAKIVRFANNARGSEPAVKLKAKDIKGATGCSRRYAYDLMDDLPEEYDWFLTPQEMTQYGSIQIDNTDDRRLGIDFEGVHTSGCPVNKFTTSNGSIGGSE